MFNFKLNPDGGDTYEVTATSRTIARWERKGGGRSFKNLAENMKLIDLYELAHMAAMNEGFTTQKFDDFLDSTDLEFEGDDEAGNPTSEGV